MRTDSNTLNTAARSKTLTELSINKNIHISQENYFREKIYTEMNQLGNLCFSLQRKRVSLDFHGVNKQVELPS